MLTLALSADTITAIISLGIVRISTMHNSTAMTRQNQYFISFSWRYFFSVGFFYWGKKNKGFAEEFMPVS